MFYPDDGGGAGGDGGTGADEAGNDGNGAGNGNVDGDGKGASQKTLEQQLEQLKADLAKQKNALDKATSEANNYKKALREKDAELKTKLTAEEIAAKEKEEADRKAAERLQELEKEVAKAKSTKSVMSNLNLDEATAEKVAESLVGCENPENALLLLKQAWDAREKALRIEFGKIPGPGAGGSSKEDEEEKAAIELGRRLGKERAEANKSVTEGLKGYIR